MVNQKVQKVFHGAYIERLQNIYEKSKEAQSLEKRRMFIRLKKFLMNSRILTYSGVELERTMNQLATMPFKEIHITENWEETYLDKEHPELHRSVLYHISKAVGKVNIAPLEIAKEYLTNPKIAKEYNLLTFDKDQLKALRREVLENPQKYQMILSNETGMYARNDKKIELDEEIKIKEYEYWYRVLNGGECPYYDSMPGYRYYLAYKDFVVDMELKSVETLKLVI
jgi:hypothetical protein